MNAYKLWKAWFRAATSDRVIYNVRLHSLINGFLEDQVEILINYTTKQMAEATLSDIDADYCIYKIVKDYYTETLAINDWKEATIISLSKPNKKTDGFVMQMKLTKEQLQKCMLRTKEKIASYTNKTTPDDVEVTVKIGKRGKVYIDLFLIGSVFEESCWFGRYASVEVSQEDQKVLTEMVEERLREMTGKTRLEFYDSM